MAEALPYCNCLCLVAPTFFGKCLQFWYNNESVVAIINLGHSKAPRFMDPIRFLVLISMKHNFLVRARHMPGVSHVIADALSRFQVQHFRELVPQADQTPCTIPPSLMTLWGMKSSRMHTGHCHRTQSVPITLGRKGSPSSASWIASYLQLATYSYEFQIWDLLDMRAGLPLLSHQHVTDYITSCLWCRVL